MNDFLVGKTKVIDDDTVTLTDINYAEQRLDSVMIAPQSSISLPLNGTAAGHSLIYDVINDMGTHWRYSTTVSE